MSLPGLLVEYLVTGALALVWLVPLVEPRLAQSAFFQGAGIAALAPAIYVLGMLIDALGFYLTSHFPNKNSSLKGRTRKKTRGELKTEIAEGKLIFGDKEIPFHCGTGRSAKGEIWLALRAPERLKDVQKRSSRDRIARASIVNLIAITVTYGLDPLCLGANISVPVLISGSLATLLMVALWQFFERESYRFEIRCGLATLEYQQSINASPEGT